MELNTRLQVEHTVTELVCGVDLVRMQFGVALEKNLSLDQTLISQRGHALEVRVYSEDPENQFLPSTGVISELKLPLGLNRRFDFGYDLGDPITPYYDPMIGKIITWAPTREENLNRMYATLCDTVIFGVKTNIEFLKSVLLNESYQRGMVNTRFLEDQYKDGFQNQPLTESQQNLGREIVGNKLGSMQRGLQLCYESPWVKS